MDNISYFKLKISPIDAAVEWFVKGFNIGLIYGVCFKSEVKWKSLPHQSRLNALKFIANNAVYTGSVLSTWWFFNKAIERIIEKDL